MQDIVTLVCPRIASKARLHWDTIDKKYMLLFPEAALVLNETAPLILKLCDGNRSVEEICEQLAVDFGTTAEMLRADVVAFLNSLVERGLVE